MTNTVRFRTFHEAGGVHQLIASKPRSLLQLLDFMSAQGRRWLPIRAAYAFGAAICFIGWGFGAMLLAWIVLPIVNAFTWKQSEEERMARCQRITGKGNAALMHSARWFRQVNFHPDWVDFNFPNEPFVLIANHPTLADICTVTSAHPKLCVLAKPKMMRNIFIGRALRLSGHIEAPGREGAEGLAGAGVITAGLDRLKRGFPVFIFPEGTRSPPGGVGRLTRGAFEIARRAKVPIIPLLIRADPPTLHRGMKWYSLPKEPSQYSIEQLPTVSMDEFDNDTKRAAVHFQQLFQSHLSRTPFPAAVAETGEAVENAGATS